MEICQECENQTRKSGKGKPHECLVKVDAPRIFKGKKPLGYEEQDYQCLTCRAKFTHSTGRNDLPWTLWVGSR